VQGCPLGNSHPGCHESLGKGWGKLRGRVKDSAGRNKGTQRVLLAPSLRSLHNERLYLAVFAAVLGNFNFGFALVYPSPVIPALEAQPSPALRLDQHTASWFGVRSGAVAAGLGAEPVGLRGEPSPTEPPLRVSPQSVFTLGAAAGGLSAMILNDRLGRKLSIMFSALPSAVGYALMAGAQGIGMLLLGRVLTGYAGGVTSASIPVTGHGREFAGDLHGGRWGNAVAEPGASHCFLEASAELQGCRWGIRRMRWASSTGTASPSWPHGAGLSCPQKREGSSSIPALFLPAVISSHIYQTPTSCCRQRGRQDLSNPGACLSSNGSLSLPWSTSPRPGRGREAGCLQGCPLRLPGPAPAAGPLRFPPREGSFPAVSGSPSRSG